MTVRAESIIRTAEENSVGAIQTVIVSLETSVRCIPLTFIAEWFTEKGQLNNCIKRTYVMTYSRRNSADEQQEACQKAKQITAVCEQFHISLDSINWQQYGMWAPVKV